tara:strand:+ start:81 stop:551 length:471 start_codon:yes stop_codon:yes gene_type:complete
MLEQAAKARAANQVMAGVAQGGLTGTQADHELKKFQSEAVGLASLLGSQERRKAYMAGTLPGVQFGLGQGQQGFQRGGSFLVPGNGGPDSQQISFMATPGERVSVTRPNQSGGVNQTIIVRGSVISERELGTIAVRAMRNATRLNQSVLNVNQVVA